MYNNVSSCVINNGYSSKFFPIQRGIRQGCPLSALLFILAVEILSIHIRNNKQIKGIHINNKEIKLTQLADDTTLFIKDVASLQHSFTILDKFHTCSGLKLNYTKTEILPLGNVKNLNEVKVKIVRKTKSLGIWYFNNITDIEEENHNQKIKELERTLNQWRRRKLTLIGRTTVIKTLIVPKINHVVANLNTPLWFVTKAQQIINEFLWDNKPPKIKNNVITNTVEMGGLKFPNIDLHVKTQKISWIKRIVTNQTASWMQLLHTFLPQIYINDVIKCTLEPNCLDESIPSFYRQILFAWFDITPEPQSALDIRRQIIWLNKYIKINKKAIFYKTLYDAGIISINDLLNNEGKLLKYKEFTERYNIQFNSLQYMGIIDAIPKQWRQILNRCNFPTNLINNTEEPHIAINDQSKNITQVTSREIYFKLLKEQETRPNCINAWNIRLNTNLNTEDWSKIFTLPKLTLSDTKVIELQFKILHRCYATNSIIAKWDKTKSENCKICKQKANIQHNFTTCTEVILFWKNLEKLFSQININTDGTISQTDILLGRSKHAKYDLFNHAIMYAKFYIHKQFIQSRKLNAINFINYYKYILSIERQVYTENNNLPTFNARFSKCTLIKELH